MFKWVFGGRRSDGLDLCPWMCFSHCRESVRVQWNLSTQRPPVVESFSSIRATRTFQTCVKQHTMMAHDGTLTSSQRYIKKLQPCKNVNILASAIKSWVNNLSTWRQHNPFMSVHVVADKEENKVYWYWWEVQRCVWWIFVPISWWWHLLGICGCLMKEFAKCYDIHKPEIKCIHIKITKIKDSTNCSSSSEPCTNMTLSEKSEISQEASRARLQTKKPNF